ncbi:MAG: hypothetical protein KJZ98_11965 [Burkholderiaceae bacterium]|nr:hypothetical protein [Burkholderiaceae bacterium]MEB2350574.1 hypothetical protein [Burkholderiaceae bacterium]
MKSIVLPVALACATLFALRLATAAPDAGAADAATDAYEVVLSSAPESPAAAFERMLAPRTPIAAPPPVGASPDALARAFDAVLRDAPASDTRQAAVRIHPVGSAR